MANSVALDERPIRYRLIKTLWLMYVLFPFRWQGVGAVQNALYYGISLICFLTVLYRLNKWQIRSSYLFNLLTYLGLFFILTIITAIVPFVKNTNDYTYLSSYLYYWGRLFVIGGTLALSKSLISYLKLMIDAINTYVLFSVVLLIPTLHNIYQGIVVTNTSSYEQFQKLYSQNYYTRFGLQGFSGYSATIMCTIAVILCCYLLVNAIKDKQKYKSYIMRAFIAMIGTAMYGRIGFIVSVVLIAVTILYLALFYQRFGLLITVVLVGVIAIGLFIANAQQLEQISSIRWMFEGFFNYLDYGKFSTSSSNQLATMYVHPSLNTFLYGDGYYTVMGSYYMQTDVGFLRPLLFYGIFGEIIYYLQLLPLLAGIRRALKLNDGFFLIILFLLFIVIFEFKGETVMSLIGTLFAMIGMIILDQSNQSKKEAKAWKSTYSSWINSIPGALRRFWPT